jgi:DNA polymerase I-like protein with 3'-5' exonuclease and polymerase domains
MKPLLEYCDNVAKNRGYVKTILGRKRRFEEWENAEYGAKWEPPVSREKALAKFTKIRRAGTYKAINSIVQGSAADQTKSAIIKLADAGFIPMLQVYDEISVNILSQEEAEFVKETMEHAIEFTVPHLVEYKIGNNWGEASSKSTHPNLERVRNAKS